MARPLLAGALVALAVLLCPALAHATVTMVEEPPSPYSVGANPYGVVSPDFNGDSRPDLAAVSGSSSNVSFFLRQPGGGFAQEGSPFAVGAGPNYAAVADL